MIAETIATMRLIVSQAFVFVLDAACGREAESRCLTNFRSVGMPSEFNDPGRKEALPGALLSG